MNICRTRFKRSILTEFLPPRNRKSGKVIVFCAGVPGTPSKDDVLDFFSKKGYWSFFPRYRGTWESGGIFLSRSLERDVLDVVDGMTTRFKDFWGGDTYRVKPQQITIVGSSFGGPAAILATKDERVNKAICVSPVVDWEAEDQADPLDDLYKFMKKAYGDAYRMKKSYWNKLAKGEFYNPVDHIQELDGKKILILHAKDDKVVRYKPVAKFAKNVNCKLLSLSKGGHLASSMLMQDKYYKRIETFIKS